MDRAYDVVLFGATGFTGGLTADRLAHHAPAGLRWAVAGRDPSRLQAIATRLGTAPCPPAGVVVARADDRASLAAMARGTRVVLTTAGPYAEVGGPVVDACVAEGADYVDITGEPAFVHAVQRRHGDAARAAGLRIVNCCGFDSIPPDLGAWFTAGLLPSDAPMTLECFVSGLGEPSGGTWHSAIGAMAHLGAGLRDPARPPTTPGRRVGSLPRRVRWEPRIGAWAVPLPTIDPEIVLRSAAADARYGPDFRYGHHARVESAWTIAGGALGIGALVVLAQLRPTRELLLRWRRRGEGPDAATRARGRFTLTFLGDAGGRRVRAEVSGGDPGYDETAKMVSESAIALVVDRDRLPARFGVLTPAEAFGDVLVQRLQAAGISFRAVETP